MKNHSTPVIRITVLYNNFFKIKEECTVTFLKSMSSLGGKQTVCKFVYVLKCEICKIPQNTKIFIYSFGLLYADK